MNLRRLAMKPQVLFPIALGAAGLIWWLVQARDGSPKKIDAGSGNLPTTSNSKAIIDRIFDVVGKIGGERITSAQQEIDLALATGDRNQITRAVSDLIRVSPWKREDIIEALRPLLSHEHPWVRVIAARAFYVIGCPEGREVVATMIRSRDPVWDVFDNSGSKIDDLRFFASDIAGQFRDATLRDDVIDLYRRTKSAKVIHDMLRLGGAEVPGIVKQLTARRPWESSVKLGVLKSHEDAALISGFFHDSKLSEASRLGAAWALTQLAADAEATGFVRQQAAKILSERIADTDARNRIKFLATQTDAESIRLLERIAVESASSEHSELAAINLVLLHPKDSIAGHQLVIDSFEGKGKLPLHTAINLTAASGDGRLVAAAEKYDARTHEGYWRRSGAKRVGWPIWDFADSYILVPPWD